MNCYKLWDVIIESICAIATVAAVFVALWQTKYTSRKKLRLQAKTTYLMTQNENGLFCNNAEKAIQFSIINIGNRTVIIVEWGIYFNYKFSLQVFNIDRVDFPKSIEIENSIQFHIDFMALKNNIIHNRIMINSKDKVKLYATDSTGKKYYINSGYTAEQILDMDSDETTVKLQ